MTVSRPLESSTSDLSVFFAPSFRQIRTTISRESVTSPRGLRCFNNCDISFGLSGVIRWIIPAFMNGERERDLLRFVRGRRERRVGCVGTRRSARRCVAVYARRSQLHRCAAPLRNPPRERTRTADRACEWQEGLEMTVAEPAYAGNILVLAWPPRVHTCAVHASLRARRVG